MTQFLPQSLFFFNKRLHNLPKGPAFIFTHESILYFNICAVNLDECCLLAKAQKSQGCTERGGLSAEYEPISSAKDKVRKHLKLAGISPGDQSHRGAAG